MIAPSRRVTCSSRRLAALVAALLFATAVASEAHAQVGDELLKSLKPWIKRQLLGETPPESDATGATSGETVPEESAAAPGAEGAPEGAANADAEQAGPAAPDNETAESPSAEAAEEDPAAAEGEDVAAQPEPPRTMEDLVNEALATPEEAADAPVEQGPQPLRFAVLAGRSPAVTMAAVGPVADDLGAMLGRPVEFLAMASYGAMVDAQVELRVDGGFFTGTAYALAESRCHCLEPIVAPRASDGTLAYHAVIVARADSGIASAYDLNGKTVAVGAADSIGARRMQLAGLMASGMDPASLFGGVMEVGSAEEAVRLVRDRVADAAFAWSSLSGDAADGYSRGTLTQLVADGEIAMRDFAIVWRSSEVGHGPFAVLTTLSDEEKDKIGAFLVTLEATRPDAYDALNPFYAGGYAPVDESDYSGLETLTAQNVDGLRLPKAVARVAAPQAVPAAEPGETPAAN